MKDRILNTLHRSLDAIGTLFGVVIGAVSVCMVIDITLRASGGGGLPWLVELTEYLFYAGSFLAAPWLLRHDGHVRLDIVVLALPPAIGGPLNRTTDLIGAAISGILAWYGVIAVIDAWKTGAMQFKTWTVPEWLLLSPIPAACLLLAIEFGVRAFSVKQSSADSPTEPVGKEG